MQRQLEIHNEVFKIAGSFTISRGARTHAHIVRVVIHQDGKTGQGECVPYSRYGETPDSVVAQIEEMRSPIIEGCTLPRLQQIMPAGAARNAVDCALWDLQAKLSGKSAAELAGIRPLKPVTTAYTISLGTPRQMFENTVKAKDRDLLKIKLGGDGDHERICAVKEAAPNARLILDANEAWSEQLLEPLLATAAKAKVELVEQPLPAGQDAILANIERPVSVCADESLHTRNELEALRKLYDCINIKLDKAGGLSEALQLQKAARALDFEIMTGCMLGTSLAMAPAMLIGQDCEFVDLDGPLLLAEDRDPPIQYPGSKMMPPNYRLWG